MSSRTVRRLSGLEIDEVSLVDRPANQHGLVTITKRDEGTAMGFFDAKGEPVDEAELQAGDVVFNEQGEQIVMLTDEQRELLEQHPEATIDDLDLELFLVGADAEELQEVGKAGAAAVTGGSSTLFQTGKKTANLALGRAKFGFGEGRKGRKVNSGSAVRSASAHFGRNAGKYGAGAAAGTAGYAGGRFGKAAPSLGEEVLSQLSKALTDGDQHQIISKVAERVEAAERIAKRAEERADALEEQAEFEGFVEIAKSFELPVEPEELGGILQKISKVLDDDELGTMERVLQAAAANIDLEERGSAGFSPILGYVEGAALEVVGKSAGELTPEQAMTAIFSANDEAYLEYLSEHRG
jgi:hypothetical protein